jgi:hypothetical protein
MTHEQNGHGFVIADIRNLYKVELWTRDDRIKRMLMVPDLGTAPLDERGVPAMGSLWAPYDLDIGDSPTYSWDFHYLFAALADRSRQWLWHESACLRVSCGIQVAVCVSWGIVVVVGPQTAGCEISAKGKAVTKGKVSTKRYEAVADRKPPSCEGATDKMRAARHATSENRVGDHICCAKYQGRSDYIAFPRQ